MLSYSNKDFIDSLKLIRNICADIPCLLCPFYSSDGGTCNITAKGKHAFGKLMII